MQEAASHADPRTTMRYDRARTSLDRHATYIVATYVAGRRGNPARRIPEGSLTAIGGQAAATLELSGGSAERDRRPRS